MKAKKSMLVKLVTEMQSSVTNLQNFNDITEWSKSRIDELSMLCLPEYQVEIKKKINP